MNPKYRNFYTEKYATGEYGGSDELKKEEKTGYNTLESFIKKYNIGESKCLEIGSGKGLFQDMVKNYTGLDYSESVSKYYHKPFVSGSAMELPFADNSFDFIWSFAVWEHIPDPESALREAMRVLCPGGYFLFAPAWHCRPWAANGYQVRPYSDFDFWRKIYKFTIPIRNLLPYRMMKMLVKRVFWLIIYLFTPNYKFKLPYKKLKANYEVFWQSDSDACCDLDPFLTILWLKANGYKIPSHSNLVKQFFSRNEAIEISKPDICTKKR